tara:strand:- start:541 stop:972 length:432 start_codon:yes stop_codon:yes gene_type:complete
MSFLYIGLGLAMISGISAMMQIGNNINNMRLLSSFKENEYYQSSLPSYDRRIMSFLNDYSGLDSEVCLKTKESLSDTIYQEGQTFLSTGTQTPSESNLLVGSCVLVNLELKHRVLIKKSSDGTFSLFSCFLKNETFCPYEVNK